MRRSERARRSIICWVALWLGLACGDPPPSKYPTDIAYEEDLALGPGDVFDVRVFYGGKELMAPYRVNGAGTINFAYIGTVHVAGKTVEQVQEEIRTRLADGYLKDPIVSIFVNETNSRKISVFGQVHSSGSFPLSDGMTIVEAISLAGGFTPMARPNAVTVTRTIKGKKTKYTVPVESIGNGKAPNFPMRPGDVVFVPERPI